MSAVSSVDDGIRLNKTIRKACCMRHDLLDEDAAVGGFGLINGSRVSFKDLHASKFRHKFFKRVIQFKPTLFPERHGRNRTNNLSAGVHSKYGFCIQRLL